MPFRATLGFAGGVWAWKQAQNALITGPMTDKNQDQQPSTLRVKENMAILSTELVRELPALFSFHCGLDRHWLKCSLLAPALRQSRGVSEVTSSEA